jgi:hypothetical protein
LLYRLVPRKKESTMKARILGSAAAVAAASLLLGGSSPGNANAVAWGSDQAARAPDWARSVCAALPDGVAPIAGIMTAWAVAQPASSSVRLVFADHVLACRNPNWLGSQPGAVCVDSWRFALTLPPELLKPGVYNLNEYEVDFAQEVTANVPARGCNSGGCSGFGMGAAGGGKGPDGTIQIDDVSESCITGRILRLNTGGSTSDPDLTGVFQATRCTPES